MKLKTVFLTLILLISFSAGSALAGSVSADFDTTGVYLYGSDGSPAASTGEPEGTKGVSMLGKASTGVAVAAISNANGYALATQHKNGSKAFATSYDTTAIYSQDADAGTLEMATLENTGSVDFSDWEIQ